MQVVRMLGMAAAWVEGAPAAWACAWVCVGVARASACLSQPPPRCGAGSTLQCLHPTHSRAANDAEATHPALVWRRALGTRAEADAPRPTAHGRPRPDQAAIKYEQDDLMNTKAFIEQSDEGSAETAVNHACVMYKEAMQPGADPTMFEQARPLVETALRPA